MEWNNLFINGLIGKKIVVKTHGGEGIKDGMLISGTYKGTLLGFDGNFLKLEYDVVKFANGAEAVTKETIFINVTFVITAEEFKSKDM